MLHFGVRAGWQRGDDQRPVVLSGAVGAGAEEGVEILLEVVCEGVDVDLGADVVEGDLRVEERRRPPSNHHPGSDLNYLHSSSPRDSCTEIDGSCYYNQNTDI